jgi:hypothetical protein
MRLIIMQNKTDNKVGSSNDTSAFEAEVHSALEQGLDVQEKMRQFTLQIISPRSLDIESVRQTVAAVLRGAKSWSTKRIAAVIRTILNRTGSSQAGYRGAGHGDAAVFRSTKLALEKDGVLLRCRSAQVRPTRRCQGKRPGVHMSMPMASRICQDPLLLWQRTSSAVRRSSSVTLK